MLIIFIILILLNYLAEYQLNQIMMTIHVLDKKYTFYHTICSIIRILWIAVCTWHTIPLPIFLIGLFILLYLNVLPYRHRLIVMKNIMMLIYTNYISLLMFCIGFLGVIGISFEQLSADNFLVMMTVNMAFILHNIICYFILKYRTELIWNEEFDRLKVIYYTRFLYICILYHMIDSLILGYYQMQHIDYLLLISGELLILFLLYNLSNYNYIFIKSELIKKEYEESEILMAQQYFEKEELKHLSEYDALTKAYNRREIYSMIEENIEKDNDIICVFIDLDGLKIVNDTYGHNFGDLLLKNFADACVNMFQEKATLARIGGDEFLLLFINQELTSIENDIKKLQLLLLQGEEKDKISFSYGISYQEKSLEDYIASADQMMYVNKHRKRCEH